MEPWESEFKEYPMNCPDCGAELIIRSPMDHIIAARRTCPVCKKDFIIEKRQASRREEAVASHMTPRRKINLEAVRASLSTICTECGYLVPPNEIMRIDFDRQEVPEVWYGISAEEENGRRLLILSACPCYRYPAAPTAIFNRILSPLADDIESRL